MQLRIIPLKPGDRAWARDSLSRPLPSGLPHKSPLVIVKSDRHPVIATDAAGVEWKLDSFQIEAVREYSHDGKTWLPESHPDSLAHVRDGLAIVESHPPPEDATPTRLQGWEYERDHARWILERNGEVV